MLYFLSFISISCITKNAYLIYIYTYASIIMFEGHYSYIIKHLRWQLIMGQ